MKFESLELSASVLLGIHDAGYEEATPIQEKAIPKVLAGRDVLGCAQTGTGKTAAFTIPTLQRLVASSGRRTGAARRRQRQGKRAIRALVLSPTRELAGQIAECVAVYGKHTNLRHAVVFGGVRQGKQVRALQAGVDVLVATPGRLLDLIQQGFVDLGAVEVLILDEADQMLDLGFIHDLRKIIARVPADRQTLMFSATMPKDVCDAARDWLRRPSEIKVAPPASTPELIAQAVCFVERPDKGAVLSHFLKTLGDSKTLVFCRTKRGVDKVTRYLRGDGIKSIGIHGDKTQSQRAEAMRRFDAYPPPVLVATDLAARGLDFSDVACVINLELPDDPSVYVHRIGRTARAGAAGRAVSFCSPEERPQLRAIEKLTGHALPEIKLEPPTPNRTDDLGAQRRGKSKPTESAPRQSTRTRKARQGGPKSRPNAEESQGAKRSARKKRRRPKSR